MILKNWNPEDNELWEVRNKKTAYKNLFISTYCLTISFAVWVFWSVLAIKINDYGFHFERDQLFSILALPGIVSIFARLVNTFILPIFGGKRWIVLSTALLLIPTILLTIAIQDSTTTYGYFLFLAVLCGFAGGSFSSSMANISCFFPKRLQGSALGINGGIGNLGISLFQLISPLIIGIPLVGKPINDLYLANLTAFWIPLIVLGIVFACFMDDIPNNSSITEQFIVFKRLNTYLTTILYGSAFGTFIGCSVAFPLLSKVFFNDVNVIKIVFIGPLLGSIFRVIGGIFADKIGATKISLFAYAIMIIASACIIISVHYNFILFFISFQLLFIASGIANGSVFALIGKVSNPKEKGVAAALSAAIASGGAFFVPKIANVSIDVFHGAGFAFGVFIALYCLSVSILLKFYIKH